MTQLKRCDFRIIIMNKLNKNYLINYQINLIDMNLFHKKKHQNRYNSISLLVFLRQFLLNLGNFWGDY